MYSLKNSIFFYFITKIYVFILCKLSRNLLSLFYIFLNLQSYWHISRSTEQFCFAFFMIFTSFVIEKYALSNIILHQQETEYFYLPKNFLIRSNCYLMKYFLWNELMNILIEILHRKNLLIFRTFPHRIGMLSISSGKTNPKWFSMKIKWKRGDHVVQY